MWLQQRPKMAVKHVEGPYIMILTATRPDERKRDLGNLEKVVSDFLEEMAIIDGDHLSEQILLSWVPDYDPKTIEVFLAPAKDLRIDPFAKKEEAAMGE